ncbi:hypothetical protein [Bernardetia litoralis]|uniref:hypothetical protein n=1 Tax=Bernardetia litoralis TaxID=999 RepID=UPI0002D3B2C2|nr:hypothetical protein [Bernardetia litoralis]
MRATAEVIYLTPEAGNHDTEAEITRMGELQATEVQYEEGARRANEEKQRREKQKKKK